MNNGYNARYIEKPNVVVALADVNNKYIHLGDIYITNFYSNNYYTSIVRLNIYDLLTRDNLDCFIGIDNANKICNVIVNRNGQYLRANNIYCVLEENTQYVEYKLSLFILANKSQYNINCEYYDISKWAQFYLDKDFTIYDTLPESLSEISRNITSNKLIKISGNETAIFNLRTDIDKIELTGYTEMTNQSSFKNVNLLYKNYYPNSTIYFTSPIHDTTNDKWFIGYFKWEKDVNHVVMIDSTIDSTGPITYRVYWNVEYHSTIYNW